VAEEGGGEKTVETGVPPGVPSGEAGVPTGKTGAPSDEDRQHYGRLLDNAYSRGQIDQGEYSVRLSELAEASSIEQMKRIAQVLPPGLDPVDLARLAAQNKTSPPNARRRQMAIIAIVFMFLMLIIIGVLLAVSVHNRQSGLGALVGILGFAVTARSVGGIFGI
jgi:hypothetical protein